MNCKISVIIPCYCSKNRHDWSRLYLSLLGYSNQSLSPEKFEVIVVDDGSEWDIAELVSSWNLNFPIKVIHQAHKGMCSAYKKGIEHSLGEYILLAIDDNIPAPGLLNEHLKDLESANNKKTVVWGREYHMRKLKNIFNPITGKINQNNYNINYPLTNIQLNEKLIFDDFNNLIEQAEITEKYKDIEFFLENYINNYEFNSLQWLTMRVGNQSFSQKLLDKIGGIDTSFDPSGWYMDLELGLRLKEVNADFKLNKNAIMIHLSHERNLDSLFDEKIKHSYFYQKHPLLEVALTPLFFKSNLKIQEFSIIVERIKNFIGENSNGS